MLNLRVVLLLVFTILAPRIEVEAATAPAKVVVAYASISPRVAPLWAAQEFGFFKKERH